MNNLLEKVKKVLPFFEKYKKYFAVGGLFVVMVLTLYFFTGEEYVADRLAEMNSKPVSGEDYVPDKEFEIDAYEEVNELIATYFDAYVNADFETLDMIARPISDMEKSYITTMGYYYEEYQNIKCYTKHGLSKDSYIVSAYFDIKFLDQDVVAPSMVLFYVQPDENGELYINNLYSDFNMQYSEHTINMDVFTALRKYTTQEDYLLLYSEVETAFNDLIKENEEIYILTKRTIPAVRQEWEDNVFYAHDEDTDLTEETEDIEDTEGMELTEDTEVDTGIEDTQLPSTEEPSETESQEPQETYVKTNKDEVYVRSKASTSGDKLGKTTLGDVFKKTGSATDENGDEWVQIDFNGKTGYILASYTEEVTE